MTLYQILDIIGTFAFAVSGAFTAMDRKFDPFGVIILSFAVAIGGGTVRDLLIGDLPVAWLNNELTIAVVLITAFACLFAGHYLRRLERTLNVFDAIGLGLFTVVGIHKGVMHGLPSAVCVALGTITACFGGVIRDVLANKIPVIFHREIYASACIIGGSAFFVLDWMGYSDKIASVVSLLCVTGIRLLALQLGWQGLPKGNKHWK